MGGEGPMEWTWQQREAVGGELDQQLFEVLERMMRLNREMVAEVSVADYLIRRRKMLGFDEDALPF